MIGRLAGRIDWLGPDHILLDVGGVGYLVHVSERTRAAMPGQGQHAALYTDLLVREDLLQLFGFTTLQEKEWHRLLTSVQGIGAKASLAILGALGPEGVGRAIALGDWAAVRAAPGVGPKLAQRVVNELKDKAAGVMAMGAGPGPAAAVAPAGDLPEASPDSFTAAKPELSSATPAQSAPAPAAAQADALSALINLGYGQSEAASAVAEAAGEGIEGAAALIRAALKRLAPKG
ncbi:MAG: Holliday junction branch migration protein RuvA [Pseudomonadota bacterium]